MIDEPLFEGHDTPLPDSTHVLVVTAGTDEDDSLSFAIECSGVRFSCEGWTYCGEDHSTEECERIADAEYGHPLVLHGERHIDMEDGPAVPTGRCILLDCNDYWLDSAEELVSEPGRYPVDQVWEETYVELRLAEVTS